MLYGNIINISYVTCSFISSLDSYTFYGSIIIHVKTSWTCDNCKSCNTYQVCKYETGIFVYRIHVYCMKMIKNILFEVLPIASYTFFPPVWQLVDATPKKQSLFWGKPVIQPFSYIFVRSEVLVRKCVSHRCK